LSVCVYDRTVAEHSIHPIFFDNGCFRCLL
jgi:hypothetical protein